MESFLSLMWDTNALEAALRKTVVNRHMAELLEQKFETNVEPCESRYLVLID